MSIWISRVGGIANVYSGCHELQSASPKPVPTARMHVGAARRLVGDARAPDARHAERSGWSSGKMPFAISVVATGAPSDSATFRSSADAFGQRRAVAGEDRRGARAGEQFRGRGDRRRRRRRFAAVRPARDA